MICDSPYYVLPKAGLEKVPVPCGRCPPCKMRRVNSWVFRLLEEEKVSDGAHFITLTYDTRFVPISDNGFMTLCQRDFQLYMKRLRKLCGGAKLKYYAVGEYGTKNGRPHYHAIVFNVKDINHFAEAWKLDGNSLGAVHVGQVTGDSIAYTMKYIDKANFKKKHIRDDRVPEFPLMSKGLGKSYLSDVVVDYHKADLSRLYVTRPGGHKIALPRYYREKIYSDDEKRKQVDIVEQVAERQQELLLREFKRLYGDSSDYTFEQWLESKKYGRYASFYSRQKSRDV